MTKTLTFSNQSSDNNKKTVKIVIISVVTVLAISLIVAFGLLFFAKSAKSDEVSVELKKVSAAMDAYYKKRQAYPSAVSDAVIIMNDNVVVSGGGSFDGTTYCVDGKSVSDESVVLHIDSTKDNGNVQSGSCDEAKKDTRPSKPGGVSVAFSDMTSIKVTWSLSNGTTSYKLQCSDNEDFKGVFEIETYTNEGLCSGLAKGTKYFYRVQAVSIAGASDWSDVMNISTLLK